MKPSALPAWHAIVGWLSPKEADHLYERAMAVETGNIVEIGSYRGRGTAALALGCRDRDEVTLTTIDHHQGCPQFGEQDYSAVEDVCTALARVECGNNVVIIALESTEAAALWGNKPIDLLFIDGAHEYESVAADIAAWWPLVRVGGHVCFHDYARGHGDGVIRAVAPLLTDGRGKLAATVELIADVVKVR